MRIANDDEPRLRAPLAIIEGPSFLGPAIQWATYVQRLDMLGSDDPDVAACREYAARTLEQLLGPVRDIAKPEKPGANISEWKAFGAWAGRLPSNEPLRPKFISLARRGLMQAMQVCPDWEERLVSFAPPRRQGWGSGGTPHERNLML